MKLLREKYKTYEGARKRAAFENALARSGFARYRYGVVGEGSSYRVERVPASEWGLKHDAREKRFYKRIAQEFEHPECDTPRSRRPD